MPPRADMPALVDLTSGMPGVYDQGHLGSCTGNAIAAAYEYAQNHQGLPMVTPSRLFIYYCERALEGTVSQDAGAYIRDGFKVMANRGAPKETTWPYQISRFKKKPPAKAYAEALQHQALQYLAVGQGLDMLRTCLADGFPFVFGFTVYSSFETADVARTGEVPMPSTTEQVLGGHAVLAVGYSDVDQRFIVRNSWGPSWGKAGYFTMPYSYVTSPKLASDFWTLRQAEA